MDSAFPPERPRQDILDAATDELAFRGVDRFTVEGVAARAGLEPEAVRQVWHDRRLLLMQAPITGAEKHVPIPDTGSLRTDLLTYAGSLAEASKTPYARAVFYSLIPPSKDFDPTEVQSDFWDIRFQKVATILRRAADRGEVRPGIDPLEAVRMLSTALHYDVLFTNSPARAEYTSQVLDIFIRGIMPESVNHSRFRAVRLLQPIEGITRRLRPIVRYGHRRKG